MAHLCIAKDGELAILPLGQTDSVEVRVKDDGEYTFHPKPERPTQAAPADKRAERSRLILVPWQDSGKVRWALVCSRSTDARVDGDPVIGGLHILCHREAIGIGGAASPLFFLDEDPARIQSFPGATHPVKCERCKTLVEKGQNVVHCPGCGRWHHQEEEDGGRECWTYAKTCATRGCPQPTSLDSTFSWTPAVL